MKIFGQKLASLREQKRLSQEELATELQLSQSTISNYEKGIDKIDLVILEKICNYFDVSPAYMFSDEKLLFHKVENHNSNIGNIGYAENNVLNTYTDKFIELYEQRLVEKDLRIKEKDDLIIFLKEENSNLKEKLK